MSERGVSARRAGWITVKTLEINEPMNRARHHTLANVIIGLLLLFCDPGGRVKLKFHLPKAQDRGELETNSKWQSDSFTDDNTLRRRVGPAAPVSRFTFWWSLRAPYHTVVCLLLFDPTRSRVQAKTGEGGGERREEIKVKRRAVSRVQRDKRKRYTFEGTVWSRGKKKPSTDIEMGKSSISEYCISPTAGRYLHFFAQFKIRQIWLRLPRGWIKRSTGNLARSIKPSLIDFASCSRAEVYDGVSVGK